MVVVWESKKALRAGYLVTALERKKAHLEERNWELRNEVNSLRSPQRIIKRMEDMGLGLLPPGEVGLNTSSNNKAGVKASSRGR